MSTLFLSLQYHGGRMHTRTTSPFIAMSCGLLVFCGFSFAGHDLGQGLVKGKSPVPFSALAKPAKGQTVTEAEPKGLAAQEIAALWTNIKSCLHENMQTLKGARKHG